MCAEQQLKRKALSLYDAICCGYYGYSMVTRVTHVLRSVQLSQCANDCYNMSSTHVNPLFFILEEPLTSYDSFSQDINQLIV